MPPYCSLSLKTCYEIKTHLTFCLASPNGDVIFRYNKKIRVMESYGNDFEPKKKRAKKETVKNIYTVLVFMSGGDIDWNNVKSFTSSNAAQSYGESLRHTYDIIPNELKEK
jgi:hypothetical protein